MPAVVTPAPDEGGADHGANAGPTRFIAGLPRAYAFDDAAGEALGHSGALVVAYYPRFDLLVLDIADRAHFEAPAFIQYLEPDKDFAAEGS